MLMQAQRERKPSDSAPDNRNVHRDALISPQ
jgi:hypothetical protein